ncbi:MAG: hypothetical protein ACFFC7_09255 [Candidatus Hermodarchaeota archaeon]
MALAGEKVGIPTADEAPVIVMPRWKQPIAGIVALIVVLVISLVTWWLLFDPRIFKLMPISFAALLGGFGLIGVLWAIWFENWPYYNLRDPWKAGLVGTLINLVIAIVFTFLLTPIFTTIYVVGFLGVGDTTIANSMGAAIFGALSASVFSFATLWVAGTMYWPWFDEKQPKRGILVWIVGTIVTLIVWIFFFVLGANPAATSTVDVVTAWYGTGMAWSQWLIFFSLLTLMAFEYWPWSKLAPKQPKIGILAFIGCTILGFLASIIFVFVAAFAFDPLFQLLGSVPPAPVGSLERTTSWGVMSIAFADFLIAAVVVVALFFDNWPKQYTQGKNFIIRLLIALVLGTVAFFGYYLLGGQLVGDAATTFSLLPSNAFLMIPTNFLIWFLWIEILFAYVWRKWPVYKEFS